MIRVFDLVTGNVRVLDERDGIATAVFLTGDRLLTGGGGGVRLWNLRDSSSKLLRSGDANIHGIVSPDQDRCLIAIWNPPGHAGERELGLLDLEDGDWEFLLYAKQEDYSFSPDGTRYSYIDKLRAVLCVGNVRRTRGTKA